MKQLSVSLFSCLLMLAALFSCKKNNDIHPGRPPAPDTLTAGWTKIKVTTEAFSDVFFLDANTGYAGGQNLYKSTNGGNSWTKLTFNALPRDFFVTAAGKIFVVDSYTDSIYSSSNGGTSFSAIKAGSLNLTDIFFADNNNGFAVCSNGLVQTTDGGATWAKVIPLSGLNTFTTQNCSGFFINAGTGWLSMGADVYRSNGSVNSWTKTTLPNMLPFSSASLFATSASVVYAGCFDGRVFKSVNGGAGFVQVAAFSNPYSNYIDLHFVDANTGYASCGKHIYKTTDAGNTWQPVVSLGEYEIIEIHFTDAAHGWACTEKGEVLKYNQ